MTATEQPAITITGPAELIAAVPYLLGFRPRESLVLVGYDAGKVVVTARIGVADIAETDVLADTLIAIERGNATAAAGIAFTDDRIVGEQVACDLKGVGTTVGLHVVATVVVWNGRWWCVGSPDEDCCPPACTPVSSDPTAVAVFAGLTVAPIARRWRRTRCAGQPLQPWLRRRSPALGTDRCSWGRAPVRSYSVPSVCSVRHRGPGAARVDTGPVIAHVTTPAPKYGSTD